MLCHRTKSILVVEDEPLLALDLKENLEKLGYTVVGPVGSLHEAKALAEIQQFDIGILDINLVDDELVFPVAKILQDRGIPVIFVSGYCSRTILPKDLNPRAFFEKPLQTKRFLEFVADTLACHPATGC